MQRHQEQDLCVGTRMQGPVSAVTWATWPASRNTQHQHPRWVADLRNPLAREHLWHPTIRSVYTNAPSAVVHLVMPLRSPHMVGDHLLDLGPRLLPPRAGSARTASPPHVRILGLPLGLVQSRNTGDAKKNICCLRARVSRAWEAHWRSPSSGMTSSVRVLDLIIQGQCRLQRFLPIAPLL